MSNENTKSSLKLRKLTIDEGQEVDVEVVRVSDVVAKLKLLVRLHRLTPETCDRIITQLGLK